MWKQTVTYMITVFFIVVVSGLVPYAGSGPVSLANLLVTAVKSREKAFSLEDLHTVRTTSPTSSPEHADSPFSYHAFVPDPSHPSKVHPKGYQDLTRSLSPVQSPLAPTAYSGAPSPQRIIASSPIESPSRVPTKSPLPTSRKSGTAVPSPSPVQDCTIVACEEPLTNSLPGSPCGCVWPIQIGMRLNVDLYTFFPLVSELAREIASGVFMKQIQVRIMGANAAKDKPDKTDILVNLVPIGESFSYNTAFLAYKKIWNKQLSIKINVFGGYEIQYVRYPGLPPPPPTAFTNITMGSRQNDNGNNSRTIKPLAVDVRRKQKVRGNNSLIIVIALSSSLALVLAIGTFGIVFLSRRANKERKLVQIQQLSTIVKPSGTRSSRYGSGLSSASLSFSSSMPCKAVVKTFSMSEIERATDNFDASRTLGEGGFGRVYQGILEDGKEVAVKLLKRSDQQGEREFLAEVEMLSRLHHRNLVKLIGICTEEHCRCLVYELIPNGSVESHLHGKDKEIYPLNWDSRMKIALGSARALAYLHEDSSPRVIHRDFKSSNILLEWDYAPKVSDFGLAKTAMEEETEHISTHVVGTFGYVAPEYAMTGHLLVKSDVYSYGVVLLELLTGRKPVDMTQPPGQENLVNWAHPLLSSKEGLNAIIDPVLGFDISMETIAKVAAIASMCVQPEASHRPFMGEVVQALKLVCKDSEENQDDSNFKPGDLSGDITETENHAQEDDIYGFETRQVLSPSDIFSTPLQRARQMSGSFRRYWSSGPLRIGTNLQREGTMSSGSASEHGYVPNVLTGRGSSRHWL